MGGKKSNLMTGLKNLCDSNVVLSHSVTQCVRFFMSNVLTQLVTLLNPRCGEDSGPLWQRIWLQIKEFLLCCLESELVGVAFPKYFSPWPSWEYLGIFQQPIQYRSNTCTGRDWKTPETRWGMVWAGPNTTPTCFSQGSQKTWWWGPHAELNQTT